MKTLHIPSPLLLAIGETTTFVMHLLPPGHMLLWSLAAGPLTGGRTAGMFIGQELLVGQNRKRSFDPSNLKHHPPYTPIGTSTITSVPDPFSLLIDSLPPICSARSRMPTNPKRPSVVCAAASKPWPSSL